MAEMKRAKSQVLFRYTPKSVFRYNETNGWCEVSSIEMKNIRSLTPTLKEALWQILDTWDAIQQDNFPNPREFPHKYEVGEPYQVHYTLAPLVFVCKQCKRAQWYENIDKLVKVNYSLSCRNCENKGTLAQVPYIYIHECGKAENVFIPKHPSNHIVVMNNRGRFQDSNWYCETCKQPLTKVGKEGLGKRFCQCGPKKLKRGSTLQDPSVHYTRTISLVDADDIILESATENIFLGESLLAALLHTVSYHSKDFEDLLTPTSAASELQDKREHARQDLIVNGIIDSKQLEMILDVMVSQMALPQVDKQQRLKDEVQALPGASFTLIQDAKKSRPLLEYVLVRDHPRMQSWELSSLLSEAQEQDDELASIRYKSDKTIADRLGFTHLYILEAFPLLLAAVGYSRVYSSPQSGSTTKLRPFITNRPKIPLYAVRSTTEALMFELDPWWEAAWLLENDLAEIPDTAFADECQLRLWLLQQREIFLHQKEAHLELLPWEKEKVYEILHPRSAALFGVLHSISHMLIIAATTQVGFEADSLSEYLFPVAGAGVIYATGHQEFTLGSIVSAFRMDLGRWLNTAYETAQRCIYDPLCKSQGGACHACSYLRFSCPHFNRTVSRSFLLGGPVAGLPRDVVGYWSTQTYNRALKLKQKVDI
jgi:hypothetical protein